MSDPSPLSQTVAGPAPDELADPDAPAAGQGLRARKRLSAMLRIQSVALDLFEGRGFEAVTVEEVAEASEVSPSSVYRYFGTKEQLVLWDEFDPDIVERLREAVADEVPLDGVRRVVTGAIAGLGPDDERRLARRMRLVMATPSVEQASVSQSYTLAEELGEVLAERLGRPAVDLEVQVFSHALIGGFLGMLHHWHGTEFRAPLSEVAQRCFEIVTAGLDVVAVRSD